MTHNHGTAHGCDHAPPELLPEGRVQRYRMVRLIAATVCCLIVATGLVMRRLQPPLPPTVVPEVRVPGIHPSVQAMIERLRSRVVSAPELSANWGAYGMCLLQHERPREALRCFRRAAALDPSSAHWPYYAGVITEQNNYDEANAWYEISGELDPTYLPCPFRRAAVLSRMDHTAEAEAVLQQIRADYPALPAVYVELIRLARVRSDLESARRLLDEAAAHGVHSRDLNLEGAAVAMREGNVALARTLRDAAALLPPDDGSPPDLWMLEIRKFDVSGAVASMTADSQLHNGQLPQAIATLDALARKFPDRSRPALNHASLLMQMGQAQAAISELSRLQELFPDDPLIRFQRAIALYQTGSVTDAETLLRETIAMKPDFGPAYGLLAEVCEFTGQTDDAIRYFTRAIDESPELPASYVALIGLLVKQERFEEARSLLDRARALPDVPAVLSSELDAFAAQVGNGRGAR